MLRKTLRTKSVSHVITSEYTPDDYSIVDDDSMGRLVDETIREIQEKEKGKIVDVKLTSTGSFSYIYITALILYEVREVVK